MALPPRAQETIRWLEAKINYTFTDRTIGLEALQLAGNGTTSVGDRVVLDGNKRLAIVGDVAIYMVLSVRWYASGRSRGIFSSQRVGYASDQTLGVVGENMGLGSVLQQHPRNFQIVSAAVRATVVEAIVGAVYVDCQTDMAVVERVLGVIGIGG